MEKVHFVLVVDDDPPLRAVLADQLAHAGFEVECASGVEEALSRLEAHPFDVVLSDVRMAPRDGFWLLGAVRSRSRTPVVLMSSFASRETVERARNEGASAILSKPFQYDELVHTLRDLGDGEDAVAATATARDTSGASEDRL
ncbi:MAG: response regulator [Myxococcales bacterium]|nr:response regulator [Myxococcales bacterium]MDH5307635.1 response regulator [Myxococcales bacterium]MDH5567376.1 response regulator [Myxococcales bacterium]